MADPTAVSAQITNAATQTNVKVIAEVPAQAIVALYQVTSHPASLSLQNVVRNQQALNQISTTVVFKAVPMITAIGSKKGT